MPRTPAGRPPKWPLSAPYQLLTEFSAAPPAHGVETFGFVARRQDTGDVYVVFRGTQTIGDWLANVDFVQTAQTHGHVGTPVDFTQHHGTIVANHEMKTRPDRRGEPGLNPEPAG